MPQGPPDLSTTSRRFAVLATRRRYSAPMRALGLVQDQDPVDTPVWVHAWPEPGHELERLPEGLEGRETLGGTAAATVGGTAELATGDERTAQEGSSTRADSVVLGGVEYEVVTSGQRRVGAGGVVTWQTFVVARVQR